MDNNRGQGKMNSSSKENIEVREIKRIVGDVRRSDFTKSGNLDIEGSQKLNLDPPPVFYELAILSQRSSAHAETNNSNAPNPYNRPDFSNPFAKTSLTSTIASNAGNLLKVELSPYTPIIKKRDDSSHRLSLKPITSV